MEIRINIEEYPDQAALPFNEQELIEAARQAAGLEGIREKIWKTSI